MIGKRIGDYEVIKKLGKGGMGSVFLAHNTRLFNKEVALKILHPKYSDDEEFVTRFRVEAEAISKLNHPNVVAISDMGVTEDGLHFIAMEYIDGADLTERLKKGENFSEKQTIGFIVQACQGLDSAHNKGILHRDLKPSNLMVTNDGVVKIADFGLAKRMDVDTTLTKHGVFMGTPNYSSPEQGRGKPVDRRSDVYSLGIVLFYLLTKKLPFVGDTTDSVIYQHIHEQPPAPRKINKDISPGVEAVVMKAISKAPEDRYQSMDEFRMALENVLGQEQDVNKGSYKKIAIMAAVPLMLLIGVVVWFIIKGGGGGPTGEPEYVIIMKMIKGCTVDSETKAIERKFEEFQIAYEYSIYIDVLETNIIRMKGALKSFDNINKNIVSINCINTLKGIEEEIDTFKSQNCPKFESLCTSIGKKWVEKTSKLNKEFKGIITKAKQGIGNSTTLEEIDQIKNKFVDNECGYWDSDLGPIANEKRVEIVKDRIEYAGDLCVLDKIKEEISKLQIDFPESKASDLTILESNKRINIEEDYIIYLDKAKDQIDNTWNKKIVNQIASECENKIKCSNELLEDLNNYLKTELVKIREAKNEYKAILRELYASSLDGKKCVDIKDRTEKFEEDYKEHSFVSDLKEGWDEVCKQITPPVGKPDGDAEVLIEAKQELTSASTVEKAKEILVYYLGELILDKSKGELRTYAEDRIKEIGEYKAFKAEERKIKSAKTKNEVNRYLNDFKYNFSGSRYISNLEVVAEERIEIIIGGIAEKQAYQTAKREIGKADIEEDVNVYFEDFRKKYPGSKYLRDLKGHTEERIEIIKKEQAYKTAKRKIGNVDTGKDVNLYFKDFRKKYPGSKHLKDLKRHAEERIEIIKRGKAEEQAYKTAKREIGKVDIEEDVNVYFEDFRENYPGSVYLRDLKGHAEERIEIIRKNKIRHAEEQAYKTAKREIGQADIEKSVNVYFRNFNEEYPDSDYFEGLQEIRDIQIKKINDDRRNLDRAKRRILNANKVEEVKDVINRYLKILYFDKSEGKLRKYAEDRIKEIGKEGEAFKTANDNIENARARNDVNKYFGNFKVEYPDSDYLRKLQESRNLQLEKINKDKANLEEAKHNISSARTPEKVKEIRDEYLDGLHFNISKGELREYAGNKIIELEGGEYEAFKAAERKIESAKTEKDVNNYFRNFNKKYPGSKYLGKLQEAKRLQLKKIKENNANLEEAIREISKANKEGSVKDVRGKYLRKLHFDESKEKLEKAVNKRIKEIREYEAFKTAKDNIENARNASDAIDILMGFMGKYPKSRYLKELDGITKQKVDELNVNEAKLEMSKANTEEHVKDVLDKYRRKVILSENKTILEKIARERIDVVLQIEDSKNIDIAKQKIASVSTVAKIKEIRDEYLEKLHFDKSKKELRVFADKEIEKSKRLRSIGAQLYLSDVSDMVDKYNFYDKSKNPTGDYINNYEEKVIGGDKVIIDHTTKLMWHSSGSGKKKWKKVKRWIDSLNSGKHAGYNDWRLPTLEEAASLLETVDGIVELKKLKRKLSKKGKKYRLFVDPVFSHKQPTIWTCDNLNENSFYIVCFDKGFSGAQYISERESYSFIRPVRTVK